jgi:hypothetical protein
MRLTPLLIDMSSLLRFTSRSVTRNIRPFTQIKRTMASQPAGKSEWLVIVPDHEGVLQKRMEVRQYVFRLSRTHCLSTPGG